MSTHEPAIETATETATETGSEPSPEQAIEPSTENDAGDPELPAAAPEPRPEALLRANGLTPEVTSVTSGTSDGS